MVWSERQLPALSSDPKGPVQVACSLQCQRPSQSPSTVSYPPHSACCLGAESNAAQLALARSCLAQHSKCTSLLCRCSGASIASKLWDWILLNVPPS